MHKLIALLAATALLAGNAGCKPKQTTPPVVKSHSSLSSSAAGHEVKADIDAAAGITGENNQVFVEFLGHRLVIESERLLLDGSESAKIPAGAKLQIVVSNAMLSVTADGTNVLNTTIKR